MAEATQSELEATFGVLVKAAPVIALPGDLEPVAAEAAAIAALRAKGSPVLDGRLALGTWQSICLVDTNIDNPVRTVRLSLLTG